MDADLLLVRCGQMGAALAAGVHAARHGSRSLALEPGLGRACRPSRARRVGSSRPEPTLRR